MKKFSTLIILLFVLLSGVAYAQQSQFCRIQDATTRTNLANVIQTDLTFVYTRYGVVTASGNYFDNGTTWRRWIGAQANSDAVAATIQAPYTLDFNLGWDFTNSLWKRIRTDTNGALITNQLTTFPGYGRIQDGDSTVLTDVLDTQADGQATTINGVVTSSILYGYNGATFDMLRLSDTNGLIVNVEDWPVAFDEGNAWAATYKKAINTFHPAKEATTTTVGTVTTVLASEEVLGYPNFTIYADNVDATHALIDFDVQVSPDNTVWIDLDLTGSTCLTLASGAACVYSVQNQSYRYVRARATDDGDAVDLEVWITANVN